MLTCISRVNVVLNFIGGKQAAFVDMADGSLRYFLRSPGRSLDQSVPISGISYREVQIMFHKFSVLDNLLITIPNLTSIIL